MEDASNPSTGNNHPRSSQMNTTVLPKKTGKIGRYMPIEGETSSLVGHRLRDRPARAPMGRRVPQADHRASHQRRLSMHHRRLHLIPPEDNGRHLSLGQPLRVGRVDPYPLEDGEVWTVRRVALRAIRRHPLLQAPRRSGRCLAAHVHLPIQPVPVQTFLPLPTPPIIFFLVLIPAPNPNH